MLGQKYFYNCCFSSIAARASGCPCDSAEKCQGLKEYPLNCPEIPGWHANRCYGNISSNYYMPVTRLLPLVLLAEELPGL